MTTRFARCLLFVLFAVVAPVAAAGADEPLRVFLRAGEKTHGPGEHDHPRFLEEWTKLLEDRGCSVEGALAFPSAEELARADVLVIYAAEGGTIHDDERARLERFLARGGGLVVIHDGVCGDDPQWFASVVGGAWEHGKSKYHEGEIGLCFVDREHPITRGVANFDFDDEIYWDLDMAPGAHVLANSFHTPFDVKPQMWTFEGADGHRAFVSIPGHRVESFAFPPYRTLLLRGIAWAGKRDADLLVQPAEIAALTYPEGGPKAPEHATEGMELNPEFQISLVAAEPLVVNPISLDWDPAGRMWVACTPGYPDKQQFSGVPARDTIAILSDADGDGRMDERKLFYEGLDLVTSFVFHGRGVVVSQSPDILWLVDEDGDDRCDRVVRLFTGFGYSDTHAVVSNMRWGLDGWIYATQGYSGNGSEHVIGVDGVDHGKIGNGVFRFRADGSAIEQVVSYSSNTWGLDFAWGGELFFTMANGSHLRHLVAPDWVLARGRFGDAPAWLDVTDHTQAFPISKHDRPPYQQIDFVGGFTAAAGCLIYGGGAWPRTYEGNHFVCEPTINLVHRDVLERAGESFRASKPRETEFLASTDLWFRPVHLRTGPDGAMYLLDFYNQAAVHNDTRGPQHGPTNAAVRPDRDHEHGRIWRIQHQEARDVNGPSLAGASFAKLADALASPNSWRRETAHRLLLESGPATGELAIALGPRRELTDAETVHRMWLRLAKRMVTEEELYLALKGGPREVRRNAARVAGLAGFGRDTGLAATGAPPLWLRTGILDSDPRVRLETLVAYARRPATASEVELLVDAWPKLDDDWQRSALLASAWYDPVAFVHAVTGTSNRADAHTARRPEHAALVAELARRIGAEGDPDRLARLLQTLAEERGRFALAGLRALAETADASRAPRSNEVGNALDALLSSDDQEVVLATIPLAAQWDAAGSFRPMVDRVATRLATDLADLDLPLETRLESLECLLLIPRHRLEAAQGAVRYLDPAYPPTLQARVVDALARVDDPSVAGMLLDAFPSLSSEGRDHAFRAIYERPQWTGLLLDRIEAGSLAPNELGPQRIFRLRNHPDDATAERARRVLDAVQGAQERETAKVIEELLPIVAKPGDAEKGRALFAQNCAICHRLNGDGAQVGPDLSGMGAHSPEDLLPFVIDPNRAVEDAYVEHVARTTDGRTFGGVLVREDADTVVLRNSDGELELRRDRLESLRSTGRSPMPTGLESLGPEALRDIFTFLRQGHEGFRLIDVGRVASASTARGLYDPAREPRNYDYVRYGVVEVDGIPFELEDPARSPSGNDAIVLRGGMAADWNCKVNAPQRVEVPIGYALDRVHVLGGVAAWGFPFTRERPPAVRWTWVYADGATEEVVLQDGVQFADWIRPFDVPGSKRVDGLLQPDSRGQIRRFSVAPSRYGEPVERIVLESFDNQLAPTFLALTAQLDPNALPKAELWDVASVEAPAAPRLEVVVEQGERPVRIVGGGTSHDFAAFYRGVDAQTLGAAGFGPITYTEEPSLAASELEGVALLVLANNQPLPDPAARAAIFEHLARGGGLLIAHAANWYNWPDWPEWNRELVGGGARSHEDLSEFEVRVVAADDPTAAGLPESFRIEDELYRFEPDPEGAPIHVIAVGRSLATDAEYPVLWTVEREAGRVACLTLGHDGRAHANANYQRILKNAANWLAPKEGAR